MSELGHVQGKIEVRARRHKKVNVRNMPKPSPDVILVPVYMIAIVLFFFVFGAGLFLYCVADVNPAPMKVVDDAGTRSDVPSGDAFKIKDDRKLLLLEQARARFRKLNPAFVPPTKAKTL